MAASELTYAAEMAFRDLFHEKLAALWTILGIAALVTPLLIMFGLRYGIVASMKSRLIGAAVNREVRPTEFRTYTPEWFAELAARDDVDVVIPDTRLLAASIDLTQEAVREAMPITATMRPTSAADPLLAEWGVAVQGDRDVVLTTRVANALRASAGTVIQGAIGRRGGEERAFVDLTVTGVLPREAVDREWVFVGLPLLVASERYREQESVPGLNAPGEIEDPAVTGWSFGSFRAFAATLDDVATLVEWLEDQGIPTQSQYQRIAQIQQLDRALGTIFVIVVTVAVLGGAASLGANLYAGVMRKRHELSLLRLIGVTGRGIVAFPVLQAVLLASLGSAIAVASYAAIEPLINWRLGSAAEGLFVNRLAENEPICFLLPRHYLNAVLFVVSVCVLAASAGAIRAGAITPGEGIRRE